ncbi:MAG: formylglycine-generating enzyme family protein [Deltaproteobacteria bacterium]|jgi:formylglycine-generating enzyme required for sulfatase activity|nr:formylglycine-generating enzyme family protein [Deltaproteobacteria bacterium]
MLLKVWLLFLFLLYFIYPGEGKAMAAEMENFILIKGGSFLMGSPTDEPERGSDETRHRVSVSDFYLDRSELTQREYTALMGNNPSEFQGDNLPVEKVTWFEAIQYCNARSQKEGLKAAYSIDGQTVTWNREAEGYRLPTETEWEYASRAGTTTPFNTGNTITDKQANFYNHYGYNNNSSGRVIGGAQGRTTPVNSFDPNPWGLFDTHGNVSEWCWDWYGQYGPENQSDPAGPATGTYRVTRGGGWNDFPKHVRSAYRSVTPPSNRAFNLGFRLARKAK